MFVDGADCLNRDDPEVVGPEGSLSGADIGVAEEPAEGFQMVGGDVPGLLHKIVAEKVAVEIFAKLREEGVEEFLRLPLGPGEEVTEVINVLDPGRLQVGRTDDLAVEEVAGEDHAAEQGVEETRVEAVALPCPHLLAGGFEVLEEFPVNAVLRIKGPGVRAEVLARSQHQNELPEFGGVCNAVERLDETTPVVHVLPGTGRKGEARVDVDFVGANEGKDWSESLIPEEEVQVADRLGFDSENFLEVDDGGVLETEDAVELHAVEGAAERVGLRGSPARRSHIDWVREEGRRTPAADAQLCLPVCARFRGHDLGAYPWETDTGSANSSSRPAIGVLDRPDLVASLAECMIHRATVGRETLSAPARLRLEYRPTRTNWTRSASRFSISCEHRYSILTLSASEIPVSGNDILDEDGCPDEIESYLAVRSGSAAHEDGA